MIHRVASLLLVVALASAGGSAPFTQVRVNRRILRQRLLVGGAHRSVDEPVYLWHAPGTNTLVADRHHHLSVAQLDDAVVRPSVRVGVTPALVEVWEAGIEPDRPGGPVPVAANARPKRAPCVVVAARAPPV